MEKFWGILGVSFGLNILGVETRITFSAQILPKKLKISNKIQMLQIHWKVQIKSTQQLYSISFPISKIKIAFNWILRSWQQHKKLVRSQNSALSTRNYLSKIQKIYHERIRQHWTLNMKKKVIIYDVLIYCTIIFLIIFFLCWIFFE